MKSFKSFLTEAMDSSDKKVKEGTIFIANDYYNDITNWYRVIKLVGQKSVKLEALDKENTSGGGYIHHGSCKPVLDKPGRELSKTFRLRDNNSIRISRYVDAVPWDGKSEGTYDYDR